jgi:hypothetical protein
MDNPNTATPEEIDIFLKSAEATFQKLGIPEDQAAEAFGSYIQKLSSEVFSEQPEQSAAPATNEEYLAKDAEEIYVISLAMQKLAEDGYSKEEAIDILHDYISKGAESLQPAAEEVATPKLTSISEAVKKYAEAKRSQQPSPKAVKFAQDVRTMLGADKSE